MKDILELIKAKSNIEEKVSDLHLWLLQKASVEYYAWLKAGGNARTAKDKVIDEIKMSGKHTQWLQKEEEYRTLKIQLAYLQDCLSVAKILLTNNEDIQEFLENI